MGDTDQDNISWLICNLCNQPFTSIERLRRHARLTHDFKQDDLPKHLILRGQATDLRPTIKIQQCPGSGSDISFSDAEAERAVSDESQSGPWEFGSGTRTLPYEEDESGSDEDDEIGAINLKVEIITDDEDEEQSVHATKTPASKSRPIKVKGASTDDSASASNVIRFDCKLCSKDYAHIKDLRQHVENVHNSTDEVIEGRTCPTCRREFRSRKYMLHHQREFHAEKVAATEAPGAPGDEKHHLCPTCGSRFKTEAKLKGHQKRLHGPEERKASFECDECRRAFYEAGVLKVHKLTHQPGAGDFTCDQCGKSFKTVDRMNRHRKFIHEGVRPFKCEECGKGFTNRQVLEVHFAAKHMDPHVNPFPCTQCQCPKAFKTQRQLQLHVRRMHNNDRFHLCRVCGQKFRSKFGVKDHERRKHNFQRADGGEGGAEKLFECNVCKQTLLSLSNLKEHHTMHTNELPYKCDTCGKGFNTKNLLDHHLIVSHRPNEELPHPCEVCGKRFGFASYLSQHKRGVHGL